MACEIHLCRISLTCREGENGRDSTTHNVPHSGDTTPLSNEDTAIMKASSLVKSTLITSGERKTFLTSV